MNRIGTSGEVRFIFYLYGKPYQKWRDTTLFYAAVCQIPVCAYLFGHKIRIDTSVFGKQIRTAPSSFIFWRAVCRKFLKILLSLQSAKRRILLII